MLLIILTIWGKDNDMTEEWNHYMREYRHRTNYAYDKHYRETHKDLIRKLSKRRMRFLGPQITIDPVRIGVCSFCGRSTEKREIKQTQLHHTKYDLSDPLKHTIELCVRCHRREH